MVRNGVISASKAIKLLLLLLTPTPTSSFYLPGVAPTSYRQGDKVPLNVNHLTPADTDVSPNVKSVFAYDYYRKEFHFCEPNGGAKSESESLGSILFGDRIFTSPFELKMGVDESCKAVCPTGQAAIFDGEDAVMVNERIMQNYNVNWLVDGLPAGELKIDLITGETFSSAGFPLGSISESGRAILNNHYDIYVDYHQASKDEFRVVGIVVVPTSRSDATIADGVANCGSVTSPPVEISEVTGATTSVHWTYSVHWTESETSFATRWDKLLHVYDPKIHWFSLINSIAIVCFLIGMVSTILLRALRKDIARYNRLDHIAMEDFSGGGEIDDDGIQEDSGWKLVHGDVFRPPIYPLPLSVLVGNGAQLFMMTGFTIGKRRPTSLEISANLRSFRPLRIFVPIEPRLVGYCDSPFLHRLRFRRGLRLRPCIQVPPR
jgi:transmembrane 9 superfamily protein 2/4